MGYKWVNKGDINPIEHFGIFMLQDDNDSDGFYVVEVNQFEKGKWLVTDCYVYIAESWIDWKDVAQAMDSQLEDNMERAFCAYAHYGHNEFGTFEIFTDRAKVVEELQGHGIEIEDEGAI